MHSHAGAWEREIEKAWERELYLTHLIRKMGQNLLFHSRLSILGQPPVLRRFSRSHAPAWECILEVN